MSKGIWQRAAIRLGARNGGDEVVAGAEGVMPGETATARAAHASLRGERKGMRALWPFLGPAFVAAVAYVDPGNFATNISGGAQFGFLVLGSSWKLLKESTNILLESAPPGVEPEEVGEKMVSVRGVEEVHDLHLWMITSGFPALAAHVLVGEDEDCHERRRELEKMIYREFGIEHTTLQVDHVGDHAAEDKRIQFLPQIKKREAR
jgi:hypothetical protein